MDNDLQKYIAKIIYNKAIDTARYNNTSIDDINKEFCFEQAEKILEFLEGQKKLYEQLKQVDIEPHKLTTDENGEIIFEKGTLIHCAKECDYDKLCSISSKGIMSGDFIGIPEISNDESNFCADFFRADTQMKSSDFIERIYKSDKFYARGPFGKKGPHARKIAFILDFNDEIKPLADTDMYLPENSKHIMQSALSLLESFRIAKCGQVSAIPYGIPAVFISGIVARR